MANELMDFAKAIGTGLQSIGTYSAKAAAQANEISRQAQSAQGAFNQASANQANALNQNAMASQWAFNSGQAALANQNQMGMWQTAANWNEEMWERQAEFNREEAEKQRRWQEHMAETQYQRAVGDMEAAGLNPILAVTGGGVGTSVPGGATASVGGAQMSSASSQMASGGILGASSASESNYMGQMEQMSSTLALLGAIFSGLSSASDAAGNLGKTGEKIMQGAAEMLGSNDADYINSDRYKTLESEDSSWWDKGKAFVESMWKDRPGGWAIDSTAKKK